MKDKIVKILENGTEGNYLLTAGNIERIATQIAKLYQPAVSEGEINDIFNGVATHTTEEGILLMSEQEFKWAIESLNVQGDAQQRYEKAVKLLAGSRYPLLGISAALRIAAGLPPQEKGGEG